MKVALFASAFYPHVGGVEELVRQLALEYGRRGISAIVLTNRWPRTLPAFEDYEGIPVYRLAMRTPGPGWKAHATHFVTHGAVRREMLRILRRHAIDLLHVQCVSSNGYYARMAKEALGLPLVVTAQGERTMDATQLYQRWPFINNVLRAALSQAEYVTGCSEDTLRDIKEFYGPGLEGKSEVIYNGINLDDFEAVNGDERSRPYILGIGRLVRQKGFDVLIEAFAEAGIESHDLVIAGEGTERPLLEALAAARGIESRVRFTGRVDRKGTVALFKGCSFFVLPSRMEPLGIVNLEAMAAGKAVVASRVGGVPEIVRDGINGVLVPGADAVALAQALSRVASDAALRERLGAEGKARVRDFAWPSIADAYERIYRKVLNAGARVEKGELAPAA